MRIAILGAGGFIGSNMVRYLLSASEHIVSAFDRELGKLEEAVQESKTGNGRLEVIRGDLSSDLRAIRDLARRVDVIVDLIAHANPSMYVAQPLSVVDLNLFDNLKVVDVCREAGVHLVQFSTCEVYGVTGGRSDPFSEDGSHFILGPVREHRWIYACAKQMLERMIHAYGIERGLSYTIVRPFNFIGPRIDYIPAAHSKGGPRVFSHFFGALLHGTPLRLIDGGHARRSYTHIEDAMDAFGRILDTLRGPCRNQIVNIGNPANETTIRGLAELMTGLWLELTGEESRSELTCVSGKDFYGEGYADCDRRVPDSTRLRNLGWSPRFDLRQTVRATMEYYLRKAGRLGAGTGRGC